MKTKILVNNHTNSTEYNRIFVVSDIHNDYESYCLLRDKLGFSSGDLVIVAGDIVDRGEPTPNPLALCSEMRFSENRAYDVIMLKGNHEQWLADAIMDYCDMGLAKYRYNSLDILLRQLTIEELKGYAQWVLELPLGIEMHVSGYIKPIKIAHASTFDFSSTHTSVMGSRSFYLDCLTGSERKYTHIVGHNPTSNVRYLFEEFPEEGEPDNTDIFHLRNLWCIDCGNGFRNEKGYPGKLGCLELNGRGKFVEHYV